MRVSIERVRRTLHSRLFAIPSVGAREGAKSRIQDCSRPEASMADDSLGQRLRTERERRKIALESIAANTKISIGLLQSLERDDVSRWPAGIFRRSFVRSYADAIGLDPDETLAEFTERFPDPVELVPPDIAATASADTRALPRPNKTPVLRLTLADVPHPFSAGTVLKGASRRLAAVGCDLATLAVVGLAAFLVVDQFWAVTAVAAVGYYTAGILVLGNTPGVYLFAPKGESDPPPPPAQDAGADLPMNAMLAHSMPKDL